MYIWNFSSVFTFHYGPIQIVVVTCSIIGYLKFTFHYGPIQIVVVTCSIIGYLKFTFHYGPIQISVNDYINDIKNKFTFHYGPIQILPGKDYFMKLIYLHSTMVLFKYI